MRYRVIWKSHRNSTREYAAVCESKAAAHFLAAALDNANWIVVRVEDVPA